MAWHEDEHEPAGRARATLRQVVALAVLAVGACGSGSETDAPPTGAAPRRAAPCDLGALPAPLDAELRLPAPPATTREVEVSTAAEFAGAARRAGTRLVVRASIDRPVEIRASDVEVAIEDPAIEVRGLAIGRSVHRVRITGGRYGQISTPLAAQYRPVVEFREAYLAEDVTIDGVLVDAALDPSSNDGAALRLRGKRIAVYQSTIRGESYSVWSGDMGPLQSEDLVLACSTFRSHAPAGGRNEATVRLVSVLRSVLVDSTLQNSWDGFDATLDDPSKVRPRNTTKHNYRVHGHSDLNFAARNVLLNAGMMFGGQGDPFATPPRDHIRRMWVNDNVFHHRVPDLFNPKDTIDRLVARGNTAYTHVWSKFYAGTPKP
ncbi:MAG: hypothetical protein QNK03_06205, partial [Myxococcota bacterium]|nr:hypothetical protein [Myxococcota bacterium]